MAQSDPYLGKQIGNYCIEQTIASGSFGTVYLARHLHLKQRTVVIKILHAVHLGSSEEKEQFLQEAEILETLKGLANILPLLDVGIDGNVPYMIAEYAHQGSLRMLIRQRGLPLPLQDVLTIIAQVGQGLQNAHDQGVVHRDLKPENILFNAKGEVLLADFGISTVLSTASVKHTQVAGTPAYMAPEQFRGEICKESDQYALACIAYELLTGCKLFKAPDFLSMGFLHATEPPTPPRQLNPQIPKPVEYALLKALSKQRTERYPSISAFVTVLNSQAKLASTGDGHEADSNPKIAVPMSSGTMPKAPKLTKKLPPSTGTGGTGAGTITDGALTSVPPRTDKTPKVPARTATDKTPTAPASDTSTGRTLASAGNLSAVSTGRASPSKPMSPRRTPPPNRNRRTLIIAALVTLMLLVVGGVAIAANPGILPFVPLRPLATVTIIPASQIVQDTYLMQGVTDNANADNRQVTVRQLSATKTATDTVNATGHAQIPAKTATGMLTFRNGSTSQQTVAPASITSTNGIQVIADRNVTIPSANPNTGAPGQASVSAHAVSPGANGNIAAGSINGSCCLAGGFITVTNVNPFTGGVNAVDYHFLQQADITSVTNTHQDKLKSDAQNDTNGPKKSGEQFLGNINCADPKTTADQPIGDKGKNVTSANVTVSVTCNAEVYDANAVQAIAQKALQQKAMKDPGKGYVLAGHIVIQVQPQTQQDGTVTFSVVAQGLWYYQWTDAMKQDLRNSIKGKSTKDAQTVLDSYPGVDRANHPKIAINNGATTLPSDSRQIALDVKVPNGLSGGVFSVGTGLAPVRERVEGTLGPLWFTWVTISRTGASPVPTLFERY